MRVTVQNLTKRFGTTTVLRSVALEVADQELFFLLGPSGCGKTTLLRLIAGFYQPEEGSIFFGDRPMKGVEPHRRNAGMVFQNYALWPHLSVAENVAYGLDVRAVPAAEKRSRVADALRMVRMEDFAARSPNQLSGGQQQRVALARALVIRPDVLLLDEPLSNLDARLRLEMRDEIRRIHDETRITTLYVTHDQKEALSMADRMAVLREGVVEQIGAPREVYRRPANRFVADFIGEANWIAGEVQARKPEAIEVRTAQGVWRVTSEGIDSNAAAGIGERVRLGFRPESVRLTALGEAAPAGWNHVEAEIVQVTYLGEIEQSELRLSDGTGIKAFEADPRTPRVKGACVRVCVPTTSVFLLSEGTTARRLGSDLNC